MPSVTRSTSSNRAERRDRMVADLLRAVERLLEAGESFTELSVERLVNEAGISRSTFYVYFDDKGALLRAMTADVMRQELDATRAWLDLAPDAGYEEVAAALRRVIDIYQPYQAIMGAIVDVATYDATIREEYYQLINSGVEAIAQHIRSGQAAGYIRTGLDPDATAGWLTWMVERGVHQMLGTAGAETTDRLATALADIVWNTLYEGASERAR